MGTVARRKLIDHGSCNETERKQINVAEATCVQVLAYQMSVFPVDLDQLTK